MNKNEIKILNDKSKLTTTILLYKRCYMNTKSYVKKYKKIYYRLVEASKMLCNVDKIFKAENKSKCMWEIINSRNGNKSNKSNQAIKLNIKGNTITDPQILANSFSNHFEKSVDDIKSKTATVSDSNINVPPINLNTPSTEKKWIKFYVF